MFYRIVVMDDEKDVGELQADMQAMVRRLTSWNIQSPERVGENVPGSQQLQQQYIWQHDGMDIGKCCSIIKKNARWKNMIEGSVRFGDNVDDEWFVVWILREMTKAFHIAVRVWDDDGEFLLIEAAFSLPSWLEPDVAQNRIWLYRGNVHCIDLESSKMKKDIDIDTGVQTLLNDMETTRSCGSPVDTSVSRRLSIYPEYAKKTMHRTTVCVPRSVASMIVDTPQCVSTAAEGFSKGVSTERKYAAMSCRFLSKEETLVPIIVTFNRFLYSALRMSSYKAPKQSHWHVLCEEYKTRLGTNGGGADDDVDIALDLGIKLVLGCEIAKVGPCSSVHNLDDHIAKDCSYKEDETWLYQSSDLLDSELEIREQELGGFDPEELSKRMQGFLGMMSTAEGAVAHDEEVALDPALFFKVLGGQYSSSDDEGSSFYDMSGGSSDDGNGDPLVLTETDSDDDTFAATYDEALARELKSTSLKDSFVAGDDEDTPVDIDLNLVSNLLSSHQEQGTEAGPVSNLAGLLGVSLPRYDLPGDPNSDTD